MAWLSKLFGDSNEKELRRLQPIVDEVNALEPEFAALSDGELRDKTTAFRGRYLAGEDLDDLLSPCCPKLSPPSAKRLSAPSASATSTCS